MSAFDRLSAERFPPTDPDRMAIAKFMALQYVRGRAYREMHDATAQKVAARGVKPRIELSPEENEKLQQRAGAAFLEFATSQEFRIDAMMESAEKLVPLLLARPWILVRTRDAPTSDLPVVPFDAKTRRAGFAVVGIAVADEIVMPVSSELVLTLGPPSGWKLRESVVDGPTGWRDQLPGFVRSTSRRYVYRRPGPPLTWIPRRKHVSLAPAGR